MWQDPHSGGFEGFRKLLFEITWALSVCTTVRPGFKHNDLHAANVLITHDELGEAAVVTVAAAAGPAGGSPGVAALPGGGLAAADDASAPLAAYTGGRPHVLYVLPSRGLQFAVPAFPSRALLADFDFAVLPGTINAKVRARARAWCGGGVARPGAASPPLSPRLRAPRPFPRLHRLLPPPSPRRWSTSRRRTQCGA